MRSSSASLCQVRAVTDGDTYEIVDAEGVRFRVIGFWDDAWAHFTDLLTRTEQVGSFELRGVSDDGLTSPLIAECWKGR